MSFMRKFATRTLFGAIILNMIIYTHYTPPNLFNYLYSYLQSVNENLFSQEIVQILFMLISYNLSLIYTTWNNFVS